MENNHIFDIIVKECSLGGLIAQPQRVTGGYMHKMYKMETAAGTCAVKLLNPEIMKRPGVFENYQRAERLERVLAENGIPLVPAMEINGRKMQCADNQYYYIFKWIKGKALEWKEIRKEHCRIAGALLGKIHKTEQRKEAVSAEQISVDWDRYTELAYAACPEIAEILKKNRKLLYLSQKEYNFAIEQLPPAVCICDGDMDSKNVLWADGKPVIIDLECLDYGNPFSEMFQLALSWSGGVVCSIDYERLAAFIDAYRREYTDEGKCEAFSPDWGALYGVGFSWLGWLEYNIKRALMIECGSEEERRLGIGQVFETMERIIYYYSIKNEILQRLDGI